MPGTACGLIPAYRTGSFLSIRRIAEVMVLRYDSTPPFKKNGTRAATAVKGFGCASSSEKKHFFREFLGKLIHCQLKNQHVASERHLYRSARAARIAAPPTTGTRPLLGGKCRAGTSYATTEQGRIVRDLQGGRVAARLLCAVSRPVTAPHGHQGKSLRLSSASM